MARHRSQASAIIYEALRTRLAVAGFTLLQYSSTNIPLTPYLPNTIRWSQSTTPFPRKVPRHGAPQRAAYHQGRRYIGGSSCSAFLYFVSLRVGSAPLLVLSPLQKSPSSAVKLEPLETGGKSMRHRYHRVTKSYGQCLM